MSFTVTVEINLICIGLSSNAQQEMSVQTNIQATHSDVSDSWAQSSVCTIAQTNPGEKGFAHCSIMHYHLFTECQVPQQKSVPTLKLLHRELYKIADKWEDIGIQLDIDVKLLDKVNSENGGDSKKCLKEMLKMLVNNEDLQPSWTDLVEALWYLEEEALAQQLKDKYC